MRGWRVETLARWFQGSLIGTYYIDSYKICLIYFKLIFKVVRFEAVAEWLQACGCNRAVMGLISNGQ